MRPGSADEESYGGRGYEQVGQEQQGGWRGPGEMPGYEEAARRRPRPFLQTSGGQVPGEVREWDRQGPPPGSRPDSGDRDPRDRDRDPQDLADGIFGVADVDNQIRVQRPGGSQGPGASEAARSRADDEGRAGNERGEDRH